jgi:hypothetical protein
MFIPRRMSPRSSQTRSATFSSVGPNRRLGKTLSSAICGQSMPDRRGLHRSLGFGAMPVLWRATLVVLTVCLIASIVIGSVRLTTTPSKILGDRFQGWHGKGFPR